MLLHSRNVHRINSTHVIVAHRQQTQKERKQKQNEKKRESHWASDLTDDWWQAICRRIHTKCHPVTVSEMINALIFGWKIICLFVNISGLDSLTSTILISAHCDWSHPKIAAGSALWFATVWQKYGCIGIETENKMFARAWRVGTRQ